MPWKSPSPTACSMQRRQLIQYPWQVVDQPLPEDLKWGRALYNKTQTLPVLQFQLLQLGNSFLYLSKIYFPCNFRKMEDQALGSTESKSSPWKWQPLYKQLKVKCLIIELLILNGSSLCVPRGSVQVQGKNFRLGFQCQFTQKASLSWFLSLGHFDA